MNITELRYLVAIMKWGSVSAAAKQMYAAQPNVSKALKNLEEEYGIRMFERSSTGMIPTEQGRHFIEQAQRVLQEVDRLDADARRRQGECAELPGGPAPCHLCVLCGGGFSAAGGGQRAAAGAHPGGRFHGGAGLVLRRGYHLALLRYAEEDEDYYSRYCARRGLHREQIMEFEYRLLVNRDSPLARHEVHDLAELNRYTEVLHDDFQLRRGGQQPALAGEREPPGACIRAVQPVLHSAEPAHGLHVGVAHAAAALEQYHLVLKKCPAQNQRMRDVLVYPDKGGLRPEEESSSSCCAVRRP